MAIRADHRESTDETKFATVVVDVASELDPIHDRSPLESLKIPGYEFEAIIANGGMGTVIAARHTETGRRVAVKVLPPTETLHEESVRRFRREADTLALFRHPHIVELIDRGKADGVVYFAMEFVSGPEGHPLNLKQACARQMPSEKQTMRWVMQIADALGYAHAMGVVHRDIKPSNIMLTAVGDVKVADFGVASVADPLRTSMLTRSNAAVGTPLYMAPEQFAGSKAIDGRADVYSFGMLLYELLTGRLPLGVYEPPSRVAPHLQSGWDKIVARAVQSDRERRFQNMDEFRDALAELRDGRRVSCPSTGYTVRKPTCPKCNATVDADDAKCRACGYSLYIECPECRTANPRSRQQCNACRHDLDQAWRGRRHRESAERLLGQATAAADEHARLHLLEASITEFNAAVRLNAHDAEARRKLEETKDAAVDLAWRNADAAFRAGALGRAQHYGRRVLAYAANHAEAVRLERACEARRLQFLKSADDLRAAKRPLEALKSLEDGVRAFPEDPGLSAAHQELFALRRDAVEFIRAGAEKLTAERRFHEMQAILDRLESAGLTAPKFGDYRTSAKSALRASRSNVRKAEEFFRARLFDKARQLAEAASAVCSDEPTCRRLLGEIERVRQHSARYSEEITTALANERWFVADRILDHLSAENRLPTGKERRAQGLDKGPYAEWAAVIDAGVDRSDRYLQLIGWALLGTFAWVVLAIQCLRLHPLMQPWGPVAAAALFGLSCVVASSFLADGLRRRFAAPEWFNALGLAVLLAVCQFVGVRALLLAEAGGAPNLLEFAAPYFLSAAALGSAAAAATRRALNLERQPLGLRPVIAALGVALVLTVGWVRPETGWKLAPLAVALTAALALAGPKHHFVNYLTGAAFAATALSLEANAAAWGIGLARVGELVVVALGALWLGRKSRHRHQSAVAAVYSGLTLWTAWRMAPGEYPITWMTLACFAHGAAVAAMCLRDWWEPRLHFRDRSFAEKSAPAPLAAAG